MYLIPCKDLCVVAIGTSVVWTQGGVLVWYLNVSAVVVEMADFKTFLYQGIQTVLSVTMHALFTFFYSIYVNASYPGHNPQKGKTWKTPKYPFNQSCLKALGKRLFTPFSMELSDGLLVMAWEQRHYFEKSDLIYLSDEAYFLVPFVSTVWSHISLVLKCYFGLTFYLPFLFLWGSKCIFWGKENVILFVLCDIIYCFYKVQPMDGLVLSDEIPTMCFSSQPFAGWKDTFWQSPES